MKRFLLLLLLAPVLLSAQQKNYVLHLHDKMVKQDVSAARVQVLDTAENVLAIGRTDSLGLFKFSCAQQSVIIAVDSMPENCDGTQFNEHRRFNLNHYNDTILLLMVHIWNHREPGTFVFQEGTLRFTSYDDSIFCSFEKTEPDRGGYRSLNTMVDMYKCGAMSKVEVRAYYTSMEDSLYGDSLALVRAGRIADYLKANGMLKTEFVAVPVLYSQRPWRNPDGSWREETAIVSLRILEW